MFAPEPLVLGDLQKSSNACDVAHFVARRPWYLTMPLITDYAAPGRRGDDRQRDSDLSGIGQSPAVRLLVGADNKPAHSLPFIDSGYA